MYRTAHHNKLISCNGLQDRAPVLHDFLVWDMARNTGRLSRHARQLLGLLVNLAQAAYVSAPLDQYKSGCVRRANKDTAPGKHSIV